MCFASGRTSVRPEVFLCATQAGVGGIGVPTAPGALTSVPEETNPARHSPAARLGDARVAGDGRERRRWLGPV